MPETLSIRHRPYGMLTLPLAPLLNGLAEPPRLVTESSGLRRRYVGLWEIDDDRRLLLIGFDPEWTLTVELDPTDASVERRRPTRLDDVIAGAERPVHAQWYTGRLRLIDLDLPYESRTTLRRGYGWTCWQFTHELLVDVVNGYATEEHHRQDTPPDDSFDSGF